MPSDTPVPAAVRRAAALQRLHAVLEEQDYTQVRLADICHAIGTPSRTLRVYCTANFGMGPIRYIHLKRLQRAHEALLRGHPGKVTVTAIAMQYGFTELGRFAADYKARFGELPSQTLRTRV